MYFYHTNPCDTSQLRGMGVDEALRERGAKDGDIVRIGNFEFEFVD